MIGHLEGIKRMVDDEVDCSEILIQLSAVRSAINSTGKVILSDHINHCLIHAYEEDDTQVIEKLNDAIDKFLK
ncbi:metal-sensing transcriptional repressor [Dehalobacter sp. DCM]|nr:metal-sensing transcriptional repressor [Dehalobacter sp. DCM]